MSVLVTGATGYLGQRLAMKLAEDGEKVHALIRNAKSSSVLQHSNINIFYGDILDRDSIRKSMEGCHSVFHVAGLARMWTKNPNDFYKVNVEGTSNMISVSNEIGVTKFVLTSSTGTIGPSLNYPNNEETPRWSSFNNDYEISKSLAEKNLISAVTNGFPGIIVLPSRIFGPGINSPSSGVNRAILGFIKSGFAVIPKNSNHLGNYSFLDDIITGHILARDHGEIGEKYILGGENRSIHQLFQAIKKANNEKGMILKIPSWPIKQYSLFSKFFAESFGMEPKITPDFVKRLNQDSAFDSGKAIKKLGYKITPFEEAIPSTIQFLNKNNKL